jgi:hypothetical protein
VDGFYQLWFLVRYIHVASVALLTGGAVTLCALCVRTGGEAESAAAVLAAPVYEWMFWALAGITAVTGVSNLGLKGDGLMAPETMWGRALSMKLTAALVLLALSLVRTDFVIRCRAAAGLGVSAPGTAAPRTAAPRTSHLDRIRLVLGSLYGLTTIILLGALWLGLGLAHGRY